MSQSDVLDQLLALRRDHPTAEIVTEHVLINDDLAVFRASIVIPDGGRATGHGSSRVDASADFIEDAEAKALRRALSALGYGVAVSPEQPTVSQSSAQSHDEATTKIAAVEPEPVAAPVEDEPQTVSQRAERRDTPQPSPSGVPTPMPNRAAPTRRQPAGSQQQSTPVEIGAARERPSAPTPFPGQQSAQAQERNVGPGANDADQPPLEDYSWTAFWKWAREQGYESKGAIEAFIGRQMNNLNPAEVRQLILSKRGGR